MKLIQIPEEELARLKADAAVTVKRRECNREYNREYKRRPEVAAKRREYQREYQRKYRLRQAAELAEFRAWKAKGKGR